VTVQILHLSDPHFGGLADIRQIEAVEHMIPDLRPDAVVISGDVAQRARHGEFQRARAFVNLARETAPVLEHYRGAGLLHEIEGTGSREDVSRRVAASVG